MIRTDRTGLHRPWDNHRWFTTRAWQEICAGMAANEGRQERVRITDFPPTCIARTVCRRQVISA